MKLAIPSCSHSSSNSGLYVKSRLSRLDFTSFQLCAWLWLGASGYKHMRFLGRRSQRGRKAGGPDFVVRIGEDGMDVAVQVRHWKSPVSKRAVDELRGALLRDNLPAGMIVASSTCSAAARRAAADFGGRPIRIIGVDRLAESIERLALGFDARFFDMVEHLRLGMGSASVSTAKLQRSIAEKQDEAMFGGSDPRFPLMVVVLALIAGLLVFWGLRR